MKNHLLKLLRSGTVMCVLAANILTVKANTYYFSSSTGDDSRTATQAQNPSTPWKSLNKLNSFFSSLQPGDDVLFKKGDTFVGKLTISRSGASGSPITISSYGTGDSPVFEYDVANAAGSISSRTILYAQTVSYVTIDGIKFSDPTISVTGIHTTKTANVGYAIDTYNCSYLRLTNLDISLVGVGIELKGNYNTISGCHIADLGMVVNDSYSNNDYGANGIVFAGSNNTITANTFLNCWAVSTDYAYDGGAIELFGAINGQTSNNTISRNRAINCHGFMEFGSNNSSDIVSNNLVDYNLLINNGGVFYINNSGSFSTGVSYVKFYNNNVVETVIPYGPYPYLFSSASTAPSNTLILKNNVFWVARSLTVVKSTLLSFTHTNNIFRMASGSLGFTLASTDLNIALATGLFANTSGSDPANWDYHLTTSSPAVDFGVDVGLTADFFGNSVYSGKSPDASAAESTGTVNIYYHDADSDGYGDASDTVMRSSQPNGYVTNGSDCDDNDASVHPGAVEVCDGKDNNCDGRIDETCTYTTYYKDADRDGHGNPNDTVIRSAQPSGYVSSGDDCDDNDAGVYPGAAEVCDGKDNNCDGRIDETCTYTTYYKDADRDGHGNPADTVIRSARPSGYVSSGDDCDDNDASVYPGAAEVCDGKDNNCDGSIDETCNRTTYYRDADGDGHGNPADTLMSITQPTGYVSNGDDCDDNDASIYPGAAETCDGKDNNCDGRIDEGCVQKPYLSISDASIFKTPGTVTLHISLSAAATQTVYVDYLTVDGNVTSAHGYKSKGGTIAIPAGLTSAIIEISVLKDKTNSTDDYFFVQLANPVNGLLSDSIGKVSIVNSRNLLRTFMFNRFAPTLRLTTNASSENNTLKPALFSIKAQPNPSSTYFRVSLHTNKAYPVNIRVIDLSGNVVESHNNALPNSSIDVGQSLKPGFYVIQALQGTDMTSQKVIKF